MQVAIQDRRALEAVSPGALAAYARAAGWRKVDEYGEYSDVYAADDLPELVVPRTHRLGDYGYVVSQLLQIFATAADTDELSLYRDLVTADRDVIRVRVSPGDEDGSISVRHGLGLMRGTHDMLVAAACSLHETQPVFHAGASRKMNDFLGNIRLGQTEQSSYAVTLLTSVVPPKLQRELELDDSGDDEPVDRQVTLRLLAALEEIRQASERAVAGHPEPFSGSVRHGVSANLCDAVAGLAEPFPEVDVSVTWARTRPVETALSVVRLGKNDSPILREAARVFRLEAPRPDVCLTGPVERLARSEQESDGTIFVRAYVDGKTRSVKTVLRHSDYLRAIQAHGRKAPIVVTGDLERVRQRWHLLNPRIVEVISDADQEPLHAERSEAS